MRSVCEVGISMEVGYVVSEGIRLTVLEGLVSQGLKGVLYNIYMCLEFSYIRTNLHSVMV